MKVVKIKDQYNDSKVHVFKFPANTNCVKYNQQICGAEYYEQDHIIKDFEIFGYKKYLREACLINQWGLAEAI